MPVTAAAVFLGHDPAIFLRTYAHLYPGDLGAVADAMDAASSVRAPSSVARVDFAGMARRRRQGMALTCTFESGCRDLNPGPLDPQSSALTKLRHSPRVVAAP